jgi:hypothetical protein
MACVAAKTKPADALLSTGGTESIINEPESDKALRGGRFAAKECGKMGQ